MANQITDRAFWRDYWLSKPALIVPVRRNHTFHRWLRRIVREHGIRTAIELGGFPGYYAIFLEKYLQVKSTLFDYFIDRAILGELLERNGLSQSDVDVIEADLFAFNPAREYDLVLSCGLIEHFETTAEILRRHLQFLKPGGVLFVTLPNFTGANGWVQRTFDVSNYEKHNINSMNPALLTRTCRQLGLTEIECGYYGRFSVWLERTSGQTALVRWFVRAIWFLGKAFTTIVPFESRMLSPYIVLTARKP
jgi:SAM-dependent methyltransferase